MRPYAPANRCTGLLTGHLHNFERNLLRCDWSPDGSKVRSCGAGRALRRARARSALGRGLLDVVVAADGSTCRSHAPCQPLASPP